MILSTLMACVTNCELLDLSTGTSCNTKAGIKIVYWNLYGNIDWTAMAGDATQFDQTEQCILNYTMIGAVDSWKRIQFERKQSFYSATYTEDLGAYDILMTMIFEGKGKELRNALCKAINCCKMVFHVFDNNCSERVFGVDWDGEAFNLPISSLKIIRHLDASGTLGSDAARDELDIGGEMECPPLYADIGQATFNSTYYAAA